MHVRPAYGTFAYFHALDASAPPAGVAAPHTRHVNYIVRLYPFGFYGLEALVMGAVTALTGSLTAVFFAARLVCVALTMLALFFSYRTALNLGVPPWTSVALAGAVGLFPMTSMVSAYVQPDNLAFAALSAALFFATQFRHAKATPLGVVPLGLALGVLAVTKYQFLLSAALPIALMLSVTLRRQRSDMATVGGCIAAFLLPAALLLAVQHWYVDGGTAIVRAAPSDIGLTYVRDVAALGAGPLIHYVISSLAGAFSGCWISGICAAGYWGGTGWGDTPIVIGTLTTQGLLRAAISLLSLATALIVAFACVRNAGRLLRAALRGHALRALWVAVSDPAIGGYLMFAAVIFALYIATNNVFGLSGRHWYPYVFVAFLCFVWYAPRALGGRRAATTGAALSSALLLYSLVAAGCTLHDVRQRYYGPDTGSYITTMAATTTAAGIGANWPLNDATYMFAPSRLTFDFPRGLSVEATGWALEANGAGAAPVAVLLDGERPLAVLARQYLFGVAELAHSIAAGYSGFSAVINTSQLAYGPHTVAAYARAGAGQPYRVIRPMRTFFVTAPDRRMPRTFLGTLRRARGATLSLEPLQTCRGDLSYDAKVATVAQGTVLLVRGIMRTHDASHYGVAWLLAGNRPYAATLHGNAFVGILPTQHVSPGKTRVSFLAQLVPPQAPHHAGDTFQTNKMPVNVSLGTLQLQVTPSDRLPPMHAGTAAACVDPLRELADE